MGAFGDSGELVAPEQVAPHFGMTVGFGTSPGMAGVEVHNHTNAFLGHSREVTQTRPVKWNGFHEFHGRTVMTNGDWLDAPSDPVRARNSATSRDLRVFMDHAAESVTSDDLDIAGFRADQRSQRGSLAEGSVRPMGVEMRFVLSQDTA
jgi:hypothetical protein